MIFIDLDNFRKGLFLKDKKRFFDIGKFPYFILDYLCKKLDIKSCSKESLIRSYAYTGEYTDNISRKIYDKTKKENYKTIF